MKIHASFKKQAAVLALAAGALLPSMAQAQQADKWQYSASIYGYLPSIGGKTAFPSNSGGSSVDVTADDIVDALKMTFMGSFEMHNGRWGAFTDVLYLNVGSSKSLSRDFTIGGSGIPANVSADLSLDLKGLIWTLGGEYRLNADPAWTVDLLAGARMFELKTRLDWTMSGTLGPIPPAIRSGRSEVDDTMWDGIIGVKGRYAFGRDKKWAVPFYFDVGTGNSDSTMQAAAGVAYKYNWGEVMAMWRYLDYNMKSGKAIEDMNFNGPMVGATWRW